MPEKKDETLDEELIGEGEMDEKLDENDQATVDQDDDMGDDLVGSAMEREEESEDALNEAARMTSDVPVQLVAVLGKKTISMKDLTELKIGKVIDLSRPVNEMVDIVAGGKLVAKGELVDIDGKLGVRIVKMVR